MSLNIFNHAVSSQHGTLDEMSWPILNLKVKCWSISKSVEKDQNNQRVTKYEYIETIRPILSYRNDPSLAKFLKDAMRSYGTKMLLLVQAYMIPTILRGVNMVAIAPPRKGKSMGLLMSVLQVIGTKPTLPSRTFNPLAVILCSSWKKVQDLSNSAENFVKFIPKSHGKIRRPRIVAAYGGSVKTATMVPVLQGCDLLIITPACLLSWLKQHEFFKLNELEMFCLDDAEGIIAQHLEILKEIMIFKRTGAIEKGSEPGQFITATKWTSGLESFVKHEMGSVFSMVVNDPMEIAVIGRMQQRFVEYEDNEGQLYQKLVAYLDEIESSIKRTVIFASNDDEILSVYNYIMQTSKVDLKLMTGSMSSEEIDLVAKEWNKYQGYVNMPILLISDEALTSSDVSIFNADIILHVDISESTIGNRLNFLRDKYSELSFLKPANDVSKEFNSFIFICPGTIDLATSNFLYKFLGRWNSERPKWLQEKAIDYILNVEKSKGFNEICPRIKSFGECKLPGCTKRHMVISNVDKPLLPNKGHVQFRLLHLDSPNHFYVRILEFKGYETDMPYKSQYLGLKMKMGNYFGKPDNVQGVNLRIVEPGLIAAIKVKDITERVVVTRMRPNRSGKVLVKLIDKGSEMFVEQADLLHLPQELSEIPAQAIEVYVTGIKPVDNDEDYNNESCVFSKEILDGKDLYAVIKLCIGSTLWVDAVTQQVHHKLTNLIVFDHNLSVTMINKGLVVKNGNHLEKLVRMCTGKIDIWKQDNQDNSTKPVAIMRKFSYTNEAIAFEGLPIIDDDNELETECDLANIISPNCFFLNNRKTSPAARLMQTEILSLIDSIESLPAEDVSIGTRLLFYKNEDWQRGYVVRVDKTIGIFSLDWGTIETFGQNESQFKKLPSEYQELPYQAILCGLYFCNHSTESYSLDAVNAMKHYINGPDSKANMVVRAYNTENVNSNMFAYDESNNIDDLKKMDLLSSLKRYSVTISNEVQKKADEMLHYVLIRNKNVLPSIEFIEEVLPESSQRVSRMIKNGSIQHLAADLLRTNDHDKRVKIAQSIERIINKRIEHFISSGSVSSCIASAIDAISILVHFVNERSIFMCFYRTLNSLLYLAYEKKYEVGKEAFSTRYITEILLDCSSTIFHMFRHLDISVRCEQIEESRVMLDNFRMMILEPTVVTAIFEDKIWYEVLSNCVGSLLVDDKVYILLMDILVQLVMLWDNKKYLLKDILSQCCLSFNESRSLSIWNSSLSLIGCFVNLQTYSQVLRNLNFFEIVFNKFLKYYNKVGRWENFHEYALDLLGNMWRNGSANKSDILKKRTLSSEMECMRKENGHKVLFNEFVVAVLRDESSVPKNSVEESSSTKLKQVGNCIPDPDALNWVDGRQVSNKKYRKSYRRIYGTSDTESSDEEDQNSESDSDSSDVEVTKFLDGNLNPADEDNVHCFEKA